MSGSVFERQTDGLQYAKGVLTWVLICAGLWSAGLWMLWWSGPGQ